MNRKRLILLQIFIFSGIMHPQTLTNSYPFHDYLHKIRVEIQKTDLEIQDANLSLELWNCIDSFYTKIIEITALYFTGMMQDSAQFYKELMFQTGKHLLFMAQILITYLTKLMKNPKIPLSVKIKRCAYITVFFMTLIFWIQEIYKPNMIDYHNNKIEPSKLFQNLNLELLEHRNRPTLH